MATLTFSTEDTLLVVSVTGDLTAGEIIAVIKEHYRSGKIVDVIWDLTDGTMQTLSKDDLSAIAEAARDASTRGTRQDGRTYFVTDTPAVYTEFCKYIALAEIQGTPCHYQLYKTLEEAKNILKFGKQKDK